MKKIIAIAIITAVLSLSLLGQNGGHKFEAGVSYSPNVQLVVADGTANKTYKLGAYAEYRIPLGAYVDFGGRFDYKGGPLTNTYLTDNAFAHSFDLLAIADFNLLPGKTVNPFIGLGLGTGLGAHNETLDHLWSGSFLFFACARAGVELFNHFRISADLSIPYPVAQTHLYTTFNLNLGWTF